MAESNDKARARRATAKAAKGQGKSPIAGMGAKVRAAAAKAKSSVTMTRNGPKAPETDHLHPQQFGAQVHKGISAGYVGRHASMTSSGAGKNAYGTSYSGKRRSGSMRDEGVYV